MVSWTKHLIFILCGMVVGLMFSGTTLRPWRRNFEVFALVCLLVSLWFWYDLISWKEAHTYIDLVIIVSLTLVLFRLYLQEEIFKYIYCGVCVCVFFSLWFKYDLIRKRTLHFVCWNMLFGLIMVIITICSSKREHVIHLIQYACCSDDSLRLDGISECEFIRSMSH
jgi:hypothetical protein